MGADDSDCSGSLTPGQMLKWSRRHIVQEGASIFPKVQAPSVDLTLNEVIKKGAGAGAHFNNSSDTLSPLATLRVPHSLLSQQFGSAHISPRERSMGGEIEQHFVGALRRAQESLDSHDDMKRPESPLSLTPSPSSATSKWLFSPGLQNPEITGQQGRGGAHLQSIQESERERIPSSEGPVVSQSAQSQMPPIHFQSCDTLGPMPSFGEDAIHSNEGSKLGGQAPLLLPKRPGSAFSRSTSKDGANALLPPVNSSAFPRLNMSESGLRQSQQSAISDQNQIRFYEEQMQALRFKVSEARIQSEVAQREKAASDARLQEKQSELNIIQKKLTRQEEQRANLEDHVALLEQKFNFPSKLPLLRGQALENARAELKQLRQFLHDKDRTIVSLEDQLADLRTHQERNIEPYVRELEALALESQRKEIVLMSLNNQTKQLQREVGISRKERDEGLKSLQTELQRTQHQNGELRLMMGEADHEIQKRETQLQTLREAAKRADLVSEEMREMQHKHQEEIERMEQELGEVKEELNKVKDNDYNYERMAEKNARQFDYETGCMRDAFHNKLTKAREEADDLKIQRDRLLGELETLRERNQILSEDVTALALLAPEQEQKVLKLPAETQTEGEVQKFETERQDSILEAQFDEFVKLLYEGEQEKDRDQWLVRVHEDVKRVRELENEVGRLKGKISERDSNVSSSDFTHKLLIQRDKQIEALKTELARYQELPEQVKEMQRYNEQLALSNQQLEMQITELSQSSLQLQSPNATAGVVAGGSNYPSLPEMRVLEEVAHCSAGLASALGMDTISLTSLAKEGANHLAVHSLSGTSMKDSRQLQFSQNPEHAYVWGQRMTKELQEVLSNAERVIKLKTTEASQAKRLLKEAKKAASEKEKRNEVLIQTQEANSELQAITQALKEKDKEVGNLKAEVARLQGLMKEQLGRSRGLYSQRGSPFTTPLTSRLEKQDERLQKALFGSKGEGTKEEKKEEDEEIVPDEYEDAQGTLIPFKTPRTGRKPRATSIQKNKEEEYNFLQLLDYIIGEVQEAADKVELEEEIENEIYRRIVSMKKNIEFKVTCTLEDMAEEVRGSAGDETGKYRTVEEAVTELRQALVVLRERLEGQMWEGEIQGKKETMEEVKETAVKLFKLEGLADTNNVFTLLQSMKQQMDGEREELEEQCGMAEREMQKEMQEMREEYEKKMIQIIEDQECEREKWKEEKEALRREMNIELQNGWDELKERKNAEIKEAVGLKEEEMEAIMQSEVHRMTALKRAEMEKEFEEQRRLMEGRQKERMKQQQTREEERVQKLETHYLELQEKGRVAEEAREKDKEERLQERKNQLERTYQAKLEALKSEREMLEQQVRFTVNQEQRDSKDQKNYEYKRMQEELTEAKAKLAYQEQRMKELQRSVTMVTKERDMERNKAQKKANISSRVVTGGYGTGSGAISARGNSSGPTQEILQMEVIELKELVEKEKKKAKDEMKTMSEKHRADLRRVQTEKENTTKRVEAACELKVKKMQQELQDKTVELEMQRESGEREVEREISKMKKQYSQREVECEQKEKQLREQTEKQVNKMKRELREQLVTREVELREQMKQEYNAVAAEQECKLREMKEQWVELEKENESLKEKIEMNSLKEEPLNAYLRGGVDATEGDSVIIPNERSLYDSQKHEEGIRSADEERNKRVIREDNSELKSLQERMNSMMKKMEETVERRCEQNKREERQRSLQKMKKARVFIVEDAFEKFAELLGIVLERLNQQMRTKPGTQPSPNRSLLDDEKYEQKIEASLKSLGLTAGLKRPSIGELAVRQVEQKVTSLLLSAKELLTLQFQEEKDALYQQVAELEREVAESQNALQLLGSKEAKSEDEREKEEGEQQEFAQVKQGTSAIKVLKDFQSPSDTLEGQVLTISKGAGLQERDLSSQENYPVNLKHAAKEKEDEVQQKQFVKKLVGDLLLMADTFTQILAEPDNAASVRGVAVWLKKETKKLRKRTMSALAKYHSVFNLLAKSVLEMKRALVSASLQVVSGPRRQEIVRLRMQNLDLHQKVAQLQTQLRDRLKQDRDVSQASVCKFEQSMTESGMGASTMTRLLHNPELLSPDQTLHLLKNVMVQAKTDESLFHLLKQSPQFSLFLEQLKLDLPHTRIPHRMDDTAELGCSDQTLKHEAEFRHSIPEDPEESGELDYSEGPGTSRFGDVFENSVGTALGAGAALARQIQHERMGSISEIQQSVNQIYTAMAAKRSSFS